MLDDKLLMQEVFSLAKKWIWQTSPNPLVWAIIVKNDKIIWKGYHVKYGLAHAEVNAITNSSESVKWAILYCNLEPCCHTNKQTPPCVDLIISSGIKKVVISNLDPNPEVYWKWVQLLKNNNIEVINWVEKDKWEILNEVFFTYMRKKTPFIHLKRAQTLDWKISTIWGDSKWITNEIARKQSHKLRLKYDGIMVWTNTLNNDNPSLSIRMWVENKGKIPYRIIFWNPENMNLNSKIFNDEFSSKTIILSLKNKLDNISKKVEGFFKKKNILLMWCDSIEDWIIKLWERKITSLLVEGGWVLLSSFIKEKLYDRISIYIAPIILWEWISYYKNVKTNFIKDAIHFKNSWIEIINNQVVFQIKN